jgi:hypothetical protein
MEENAELEVCLFGAQFIRQHLELVDVKHGGDKVYYKNSLREIEVYPPRSFFDKTYALLQ